MTGVASLDLTAEKISLLMNAETEVSGERISVKKTRVFNIQNSGRSFAVSLDLDISFSSFKEDGTALNKAEVWMLPEEYADFSSELMQHQIPFPTNYSQCLLKNPDIYSVRLESREPPENFAERLSAVLSSIEKSEPVLCCS